MTRARLEAVAADPAAAGKLLEQASRQLDDAGSPALSPESAYALAYQATFYEVDEVSAAMVRSALADAAEVVAAAEASLDRGSGT